MITQILTRLFHKFSQDSKLFFYEKKSSHKSACVPVPHSQEKVLQWLYITDVLGLFITSVIQNISYIKALCNRCTVHTSVMQGYFEQTYLRYSAPQYTCYIKPLQSPLLRMCAPADTSDAVPVMLEFSDSYTSCTNTSACMVCRRIRQNIQKIRSFRTPHV